MNKSIPIVLSLVLLGSAIPAFAEPGDCNDELTQLNDAIFRQMFVTKDSKTQFDIGVLNGMQTAKGLWSIGSNDCDYVRDVLPQIIDRYQSQVELYESFGFDYQFGKGIVQGLGIAQTLVGEGPTTIPS